MLYDPLRHEPVTTTMWSEDAALLAIERIVTRSEAAWSDSHWWPIHPLDREGSERPGQIETPLYHGATGVVWALRYLHSVGASRLRRDYRATDAGHVRWHGKMR